MADSLQTEIAVESRLGQSGYPLATTTDALLVTRAQNGEYLAYVELCRRHREMVFRTALRITRNPDDAEDVLQDSWMRAFAHIGSFDQRSAFSTWVTQIAINSALMTMRRRRTRRELSLDDPIDSDNHKIIEMLEPSRNPEERCLETERTRLVRQAIKRLPPKLRTAIELRQFHEGSIRELAMLAGVSLPTMKSRLLRARLRLREPLSKALRTRSVARVLPRTIEADLVRRIPRRKERSEKSAVARDQYSVSDGTVRLNDTSVNTSSAEACNWVIG
ncbi:MAG: sigma-70 family RNA polymerase sigma factor [Edaphobacter sp.]